MIDTINLSNSEKKIVDFAREAVTEVNTNPKVLDYLVIKDRSIPNDEGKRFDVTNDIDGSVQRIVDYIFNHPKIKEQLSEDLKRLQIDKS